MVMVRANLEIVETLASHYAASESSIAVMKESSAILMPHAESLLRFEDDSTGTTIAESLEWNHLR